MYLYLSYSAEQIHRNSLSYYFFYAVGFQLPTSRMYPIWLSLFPAKNRTVLALSVEYSHPGPFMQKLLDVGLFRKSLIET